MDIIDEVATAICLGYKNGICGPCETCYMRELNCASRIYVNKIINAGYTIKKEESNDVGH